MVPEPTDNSDALDHYAELLAAWQLEALCLTVVRGLTVEEALRRFDGVATGDEQTVVDLGEAASAAFPDDLPLVLADELDGGVVLLENNGYHGADRAVLARLSAGTTAASAYWNVNLVSQVSLAHDGDLVDAFDFVVDEPPTGGGVEPFVRGLDFADDDRTFASALAFVERVSGVRVPVDWAGRPHPVAMIGTFHCLTLPDADRWLENVAPDLHAAMLGTDGPRVRAVTTLAAAAAGEAAGVDSVVVDVDTLSTAERASFRDRLASRAEEEYHRALHLRWARSRPEYHLDPLAAWQSQTGRNAGLPAEHGLVARAHAVAATRARFEDDPGRGLALAVVNACQIDKQAWPALRDRLTHALLSPGG